MGHFFSFSGRSGRLEYILVLIFSWVLLGWGLRALLLLVFIDFLPNEDSAKWLSLFVFIWWGYMLLSATVRRLHDLGFSAWWLFLGIIALVVLKALGGVFFGGLASYGAFFILSCWPGDKGTNSFGPEPDLLGGFFEDSSSQESEASENSEDQEQGTGRIDFKL